ncbi:MAG: exosortase C-terminal domain/associated protein EpsI [Bryobacteraceae bacterium]
MPNPETAAGFLRSRHALILTLALAVQAAVVFAFGRTEAVPPLRPLKELPAKFAGWSMASEGVVEQEVQAVLRADDTLTRVYRQDSTDLPASLFVAYFRTQRTGQAPHSPKNCLPGAGWVPSASETVAVTVPGVPEPIRVNRYVVSRGDEKSIVLYWYQTPTRIIASEYEAKFYLVVDSIRYHRSDTALVRVVSPVVRGDEQAADRAAVDFVQSFFLPLRQHLPF